jgi:LDH2 family malate/lactate/ureidoglycolate dehydrogenase
MSQQELQKYPAASLRQFTERIFLLCGLPDDDAVRAADVLITADLWGIDTHGVARLKNYYEMLAGNFINPRPEIRIVRELPGTATVDGDNGLGLVVGPKAFELALEKAQAVGVGWVGVCNSSHFGIAGYYPHMALAHDIIGIAMTNTTPQVAPLWGAERMLGTNPIAIAFPGLEEPPVLIDMATSAAAYGKIENAIRKNETVPRGWLIDGEGRETTRPQDLGDGGAILPLGGDREHGGHKGYCLAAMIDLLCGVLPGANWGPFVPPFPYYLKSPGRSVGKGIGHFFGALRIDGFSDPVEFKQAVDAWRRVMRATKPAPGTQGPLVPGDPERLAHAVNLREGIPLLPSVVADLSELAARTGLAFTS